MDSITTVEQLIQSFEDADPSEQGLILNNIEIPKSEFKEFASWSEGCYTRNCLARTDYFEFILICWDGNCQTKIHDHDGQNCWVYQVDSQLREVRFEGPETKLKVYSDNILNEGEVSYMNDQMGYHRIENPNDKKAMTLHIYANPIDQCKVYNEDTSSFEVATMVYDSVHEVIEAD